VAFLLARSCPQSLVPSPKAGRKPGCGTYTVTLQDGIGRQSGVSFSVIRDTTPPTLTLEAVVQRDVLVTWSAADSGSGVYTSTCLLEVREDEGAWQTVSTRCGGEDDTHDGQPGHTYTFRLSASDNVSNAASTEVEALVPYVTKYYYANGQRVAMQKEGVVYYLHSDHLGSTSILSDENGQQVADSRVAYLPYGGVRLGDASTLPTDYTFTGQRNEAGLGLMHYGARFYSPRLGRFVSADSIVPQPGEPQALNRYAYAANNPVIYRDPSGHAECIYSDCNLVQNPAGNIIVTNVGGSALFRLIIQISQGKSTAANRLERILSETRGTGKLPNWRGIDAAAGGVTRTHFRGLGGLKGDAGFRTEFGDDHLYGTLWGQEQPASQQVGHFLTAVDMGYDGPEIWKVGIVGHEQVSDKKFTALAEEFIRPTRADIAAFEAAVGFDAFGDDTRRDTMLQSILDPARWGSLDTRVGNSMEDLRLSVRGWRLGNMVASSDIKTNKDFANWIALNVAGD
jgi:RHS repeat-associated protein